MKSRLFLLAVSALLALPAFRAVADGRYSGTLHYSYDTESSSADEEAARAWKVKCESFNNCRDCDSSPSVQKYSYSRKESDGAKTYKYLVQGSASGCEKDDDMSGTREDGGSSHESSPSGGTAPRGVYIGR